MDYQEYIKSELLAMVPVLYIIGLGLKESKLADKWIPLVLGVTGIALATIWVISTSPITTIPEAMAALFTAVTQGILAAGTSVYANQIYLQANKDSLVEVVCDYRLESQAVFNERFRIPGQYLALWGRAPWKDISSSG